jgi:uroporphyrinogen-III decarboxylase
MAAMTPKQRMLTALQGGVPDRLPVTTHHVMPYFLENTMQGMTAQEFFDHLGFDAITWPTPHTHNPASQEYPDPEQQEIGFLESRRVSTDEWRIHLEDIPGQKFKTTRYIFETPKGQLTTVLQSNEYTTWVNEHLLKEPKDLDVILDYVTAPRCDVAAVNQAAADYGERGLVRGHIPCFDVFGQPGCWQDAACLMDLEQLIYMTYDDPEWVHTLLRMLQARKLVYINSLKGARYDLLELGGGSASSTVISPKIFDAFVAPYDSELIRAAHDAGQRIAYHTCGGMMPLLERIAAMQPDAMETFTPRAMGGDTHLAEAKQRIGSQVCMIGGFDQFHFFVGCTPEETRAEVRRCFAEAGPNGAYILAPSDHFFEAEPELLRAFVDEAHQCVYEAVT